MTQSEITKLHRSIATDFKIAARKTELWSLQQCYDYLHDIKKLMQFHYIETVSLVLKNAGYYPLKAKQYIIISTSSGVANRPGNVDWDEGEGQVLDVVLSHTESYRKLTSEELEKFGRDNLRSAWYPSNVDTNFPHLSPTHSKIYSHENSQINRTDFN